MKKWIKNNKKSIFAFVLGAIMFSTIGVYAAIVVAANEVSLSSTKTSKTNVQDALDELYSKAGCFSSPFKLGDYVSMTPDSTSYSIAASLTGYSSAQTINPSELNLWRVIKINDDCTVDMVSEYVSSTRVYFGTSSSNKTGFTDAQVLAYKNYVGTLNTIAKQYGKSGYTVGARHIGYKNQTEIINDTSNIKSSTPPWSVNTGLGITVESQGGGDTGYTYDLSLLDNAIGGFGAYKVGTTTQTDYWLPSRIYYYYSAAYYSYNLRYANSETTVYSSNLHDYSSGYSYSYSCCNGVRPIVTLGSTVKTGSGNGTASSPYTLTK